MAEVVKSIRASGGDYSTIAAWAADLDNGAVYTAGDDAIGELYAEDYTATISVSLGGTVGLASITLRAASGQKHSGTPGSGHARVIGSGHVFTTPNIWTYVEDIEFNGNGASTALISVGSGDDLQVARCIIHNTVSSGGSALVGINASGSTGMRLNAFDNVIFNIKKSAGSASAYGIRADSGTGDQLIYNNTVTDIGVVDGTAVGIAYIDDANTALANNLTALLVATGSGSTTGYSNASPANAVCTTNGSDDATSPNSALRNLSISFDDAANDDYRLAAGDTGAIDVGTDLGAGEWSTDILGRDRDAEGDTWDLGAFETVSAAASVGHNLLLLGVGN